MPYVASSRSTGSYKSSGIYDDGSFAGSGARLDAITAHEAVYSYRTGGKVAEQDTTDSVKPDPDTETYKPTGSIVERLVYRKRFLERQIALATSRAGAPTHFLLGDMGHEFGTAKSKFVGTDNWVRVWNNNVFRSYTNVRPAYIRTMNSSGTLVVTDALIDPFSGYFGSKGFHFSTQGSSFGPSMTSIKGHAANHISEMNPFEAKVSIFAALLELARGDIPSVFRGLQESLTLITRMKAAGIKDAAQAVGSGYLNNVFGWTPILRDVDSAIKTLLVLDSMLFPEDSTRRNVRRVLSTRGGISEDPVGLWLGPPLAAQSTLANSFLVNDLKFSGLGFSQTSAGVAQPAQTSVLEEISVWTTARFNTTARPSATNNGYLDKAIDLLGLELTPEVLWQVTPWSWLIDWFSNMGTVIGNLSTLGLSNTILNYAYSTARLKTSVGVQVMPRVQSSGSNVITAFGGDFFFSYNMDYKVRVAASPFGFDVSLGSLSASQWAILTALGLARSR